MDENATLTTHNKINNNENLIKAFKSIVEEGGERVLDGAFLTHSHLDHIFGLMLLTQRFGRRRIEETDNKNVLEIFSSDKVIDDIKNHVLNDAIWPTFQMFGNVALTKLGNFSTKNTSEKKFLPILNFNDFESVPFGAYEKTGFKLIPEEKRLDKEVYEWIKKYNIELKDENDENDGNIKSIMENIIKYHEIKIIKEDEEERKKMEEQEKKKINDAILNTLKDDMKDKVENLIVDEEQNGMKDAILNTLKDEMKDKMKKLLADKELKADIKKHLDINKENWGNIKEKHWNLSIFPLCHGGNKFGSPCYRSLCYKFTFKEKIIYFFGDFSIKNHFGNIIDDESKKYVDNILSDANKEINKKNKEVYLLLENAFMDNYGHMDIYTLLSSFHDNFTEVNNKEILKYLNIILIHPKFDKYHDGKTLNSQTKWSEINNNNFDVNIFNRIVHSNAYEIGDDLIVQSKVALIKNHHSNMKINENWLRSIVKHNPNRDSDDYIFEEIDDDRSKNLKSLLNEIVKLIIEKDVNNNSDSHYETNEFNKYNYKLHYTMLTNNKYPIQDNDNGKRYIYGFDDDHKKNNDDIKNLIGEFEKLSFPFLVCELNPPSASDINETFYYILFKDISEYVKKQKGFRELKKKNKIFLTFLQTGKITSINKNNNKFDNLHNKKWTNYFPYVKIPDKMDQHGCINYSSSTIDETKKDKKILKQDTENKNNIKKMRNYNNILHSIDGWKIFKW